MCMMFLKVCLPEHTFLWCIYAFASCFCIPFNIVFKKTGIVTCIFQLHYFWRSVYFCTSFISSPVLLFYFTGSFCVILFFNINLYSLSRSSQYFLNIQYCYLSFVILYNSFRCGLIVLYVFIFQRILQ